MSIIMTQINNQVRQLNEQASLLRGAQSSLLLYQRNLNTHWRGTEMTHVNQALDRHVKKLAEIVVDLDVISNDIVREAEAIRREEENI